MSYNRNLSWYNIDTLRDLQIPTYLLALSDSRVIAINIFAYGRKNQGVVAFPDLMVPHVLVGERNMIAPFLPACATFFPDNSGNGRRTVTVKAYDAYDNLAEDSIFVIVSN
jgi:hypothetical protein